MHGRRNGFPPPPDSMSKDMVIKAVRQWAAEMNEPVAGEQFLQAMVFNDEMWRTWPSRSVRFVHILFGSFGMGYKRGKTK